MADFKTKAFDVVLEWSKQEITIASGTLVLSGTFLKDILRVAPNGGGWLISCWIALLISITFGVVVMQALIAELNKNKSSAAAYDVYATPIRVVASVQAITFLLGMAFFLVFIVRNVQ